MWEEFVAKGAYLRHPLIEDKVQAEIMAHVRDEARPVSRARLAEALNPSRGKISAEVGRLIEAGLLAEEGFADSEGGRRSSLLGIPYFAGLIGAIDIGATSIDVALTTLGSELLARRGEPADVRDGPRKVIDRVKALLAELLEERVARTQDVLAIGVGVPGPVEQASGRLTVPPIMPGWDQFLVREAFAGEYAAPVYVDNDVNIMALGEHWGGKGHQRPNLRQDRHGDRERDHRRRPPSPWRPGLRRGLRSHLRGSWRPRLLVRQHRVPRGDGGGPGDRAGGGKVR
jgi:hypothetical protein